MRVLYRRGRRRACWKAGDCYATGQSDRRCQWLPLVWRRRGPAPVTSPKKGADRRGRPSHRPWRARAQPEECLARPASRLAHRLHGPVRVGQVLPGLRHDLRRGPAALRGIPLLVRPAVPRPDGQAGRRLHRGPVPGGLHRPEVDLAQPPLDRRHHHRGLRLPPAALRAHRQAALPRVRPPDHAPVAAGHRGQGPGAAGGQPLPGAVAAGARAQGRVRGPLRRPPGEGLLPRARGRHDRPAVRAAGAEEAGEAHHRGGRGPPHGEGLRQAPPHRLRGDRPRPVRRHGRARLRGPPRGRPRARAHVLGAPVLPVRRPVLRGAGAALLLLQLALRRLSRVHRHRYPHGGRPGADRPGPRQVPGRRRHPPLVARTHQGLLRPPDRRPRGRARLPHGHPLRGSAAAREEGPAVRPQDPDRGALPQPVRPRARVHHAVRGRGALRQAPAQRGRERRQPGALRGLYARGALPLLRGHPPQADRARRDHHGEVDRRGLRDVDQRLRGVPGRTEAERAGQEDRRAGAEGGQRAAALPGRRRPGLPLAQPRRRHPLRRRGPAHPPRHPDRLRPGRRAVRAGRALHRSAPARQPPADRDPGAAARHGQHAHRGGARRGHHQGRRLGGGHRPRRR
ncbi:hypothetical protein SGPA1_31421 [Streptomyces misionensis JCM 4497]